MNSASTHASVDFEEQFTAGFGVAYILCSIHKYFPDISVDYNIISKTYRDIEVLWASKVSSILKDRQQSIVTVNHNTKVIEEYEQLIVPGLFSSLIPDILIKDTDGNIIVHIEVVSETLERTIRKMFFNLVLQLLYIRSAKKEIKKVSGIVLPTIFTKADVWNPYI